MKKDIPDVIKDVAKPLGDNIQYIGEYEQKEAYMFFFPENTETGFPIVYLFDKNTNIVEGKTGYEASDIINTLFNE